LIIASSAGLATSPTLYRLGLPQLKLASEDGERISAVEIAMSCGRFRGITNIPDDWSVQVVSPSSEETSLRAEAGHGSAALWNLQPFDLAIKIEITQPDCFKISAQVTADTSSNSRMISLARKELRLIP
jgi:hypothetical protein